MARRSALTLAALTIVPAAAAWIGSRRQHSSLVADTERLLRLGAERAAVGGTAAASLDGLPPPVARYLRLAVRSPQQIQEVRIGQRGTLRTSLTTERWMPFEAEHLVVPPARGFLWNARCQAAPLVHVRVRDALIDDVGSGQVSLFSALTVKAVAGGIEMNSGSLHRYLAEAVWYPTALLPQPGLEWTPIDAKRARATLSSGDTTVSLEFRFADSGEVSGIYTPGRWGAFEGGYRQVPWEGHFRDYRERNGFLVPTEGEVGWYTDNNDWRVVWKGTVTDYRVRTRG
jgi:hypothetical protein